MTKYLSTVFLSIRLKPIAISNRVHTFLRCKYSSNSEQCYSNSDNQNNNNFNEINDQRLLKVAIIGVPNAGKSSVINSIVQRNVSTVKIVYTFKHLRKLA